MRDDRETGGFQGSGRWGRIELWRDLHTQMKILILTHHWKGSYEQNVDEYHHHILLMPLLVHQPNLILTDTSHMDVKVHCVSIRTIAAERS